MSLLARFGPGTGATDNSTPFTGPPTFNFPEHTIMQPGSTQTASSFSGFGSGQVSGHEEGTQQQHILFDKNMDIPEVESRSTTATPEAESELFSSRQTPNDEHHIPMGHGIRDYGHRHSQSREYSLPSNSASPAPATMAGTRRSRGIEDGFSSNPPRSGSTSHQLRAFATRVSVDLKLSHSQADELVKMAEMPLLEMLISNQAHMFRLENGMNSCVGKLYQRHPDFLAFLPPQKRLRHNVAAALLAPNAGAYVVGVHKKMTAHFEHNLTLLGLTAASRQDIVDWGAFTSEVSNELTQQRSTMKSKLEQSVKNKLDIYSLVDNLLIYDIRPKTAHWGRIAFLRECYITWQASNDRKKGTFWENVDKELKDVREKLKTKVDQAVFFAKILEANMTTYIVDSVAQQVYEDSDVPDWQNSMENAVAAN